MAKECGRVFADEVNVSVTVKVGQLCTIAADHSQRERLVMENASRVAAGQVSSCFLISGLAQRVCGRETCTGVCNCVVQCIHWMGLIGAPVFCRTSSKFIPGASSTI